MQFSGGAAGAVEHGGIEHEAAAVGEGAEIRFLLSRGSGAVGALALQVEIQITPEAVQDFAGPAEGFGEALIEFDAEAAEEGILSGGEGASGSAAGAEEAGEIEFDAGNQGEQALAVNHGHEFAVTREMSGEGGAAIAFGVVKDETRGEAAAAERGAEVERDGARGFLQMFVAAGAGHGRD